MIDWATRIQVSKDAIKRWLRTRKWDELRELGTSRLVRLTFVIPIVGYYLLFSSSLDT